MTTADKIKDYLYNGNCADFDEHNIDVVDLLCEYFSNDKSFVKKGEHYSLRKGLFISGNIGCGKTFFMKLLQENLKNYYRVVNCREVADMYAKDGEEAIEKYASIREYWDKVTGKRMRGLYPYCFDDLGTEADKKYFGNDMNVMADILQRRHYKGDFTLTHVTTNLSAEELKARYGNRLTSRFKEMFNFINFPPEAIDRRQ